MTMMHCFLTPLLIIIQFCTSEQVHELSRSARVLIIKGVPAPARMFYARVRHNSGFCGASIINARFAVTAANCLFYCRRKYRSSVSQKDHMEN